MAKKATAPVLRWMVVGDQHFMFIGDATHPAVELKLYQEEYYSGNKLNKRLRCVLNGYRLGRDFYPKEVTSKVKVYKFYEAAATEFLKKYIGK